MTNIYFAKTPLPNLKRKSATEEPNMTLTVWGNFKIFYCVVVHAVIGCRRALRTVRFSE